MSKYAFEHGIAVIRAVNPPVNGLSKAVRTGLVDGLKQAQKDQAKSIIIVGDGRTFPAGADITEFKTGEYASDPDLNAVIRELDASQIPLIAAIHGTALGGGMETALGCHYRVALPTARMGLPEVHLGLLPGAGGTQRLPRVVGVEKALTMMGTGKPVTAGEAKKIGLVDEVIDGQGLDSLIDGAKRFAEKIVNKKEHPKISTQPCVKVDDAVYENAKNLFKKVAKNQIAPLQIVDAVKACEENSGNFLQGLKEEGRLFQELMDNDQSKGMQHVFFAERSCSKVPNVNPKLAAPITSVGVIGGGTMGRGIAMNFMNKGIPVIMVEETKEKGQAAFDAIQGLYKKSSAYKKGKLTDSDVAAKMGFLQISSKDGLGFESLKNVTIVIEAAFESMTVKEEIFGALHKICDPNTIFCSNTSYLDIDAIAKASGRPDRFAGTHFFSPANIMPLLENIKGAKTSDKTIATIMKMGQTIGKTTVLAGNCFGFIGNRMFEPYVQEAVLLLEEGCSPSRIDSALNTAGFGFAMGPLAVLDLAGNDIGYSIRREDYYVHKGDTTAGDRAKSWMALADTLCESGRLGQKTGAGWYTYEGRNAVEDKVVTKMIQDHSQKFNIKDRSKEITDEEIVERCMYPMINVGFNILEEGIATQPSDIDVVFNAGYGFPRYRGGPMLYCDTVGINKVYTALQNYHKKFPELPHWHFKAGHLFETLATSNTKVTEFWSTKKQI